MNVQCGICKDSIDVLTKNGDCSVASALPCGHVFHFHCITHWLNQSASKIQGSCPHCRSSVLKKQVLKLYLDLAPLENYEEDPTVIKANNHNLNREIETLKEKLAHNVQTTDKLTAINIGLRERVLDLESNLSKAQTKERLLQVAQQKLNSKTKDLENALDENKRLKNKLASLQATSAIINGSLSDFDDALPALEKSDLADLVYTYKKDVLSLGRKNEALFNDVSRAQEESRKLRKELERQKNDNSILSRIVEMYKPKGEPSPAQNPDRTLSSDSDPVLDTVDLTSPPGPQVVRKTNTPKIVTPSRKRLLPCKSFKIPHGGRTEVQVSPLAFSYDGLGGHSRVEEFPKPCSAKRPKILLGVMMCPRELTVDGYEMQFATNHLGHFLFTLLLLPTIIASAPARIVNVSSKLHLCASTMFFDDINMANNTYTPVLAYGRSKLANILFTKELAERLKGTGVTVYALHPGVVDTDLTRHVDSAFLPGARWLYKNVCWVFQKSPVQGAQTTLHCALDEKAGNETGLYYDDCVVTTPTRYAQDPAMAKELWEKSLEIVQLTPGFDPFAARTT